MRFGKAPTRNTVSQARRRVAAQRLAKAKEQQKKDMKRGK